MILTEFLVHTQNTDLTAIGRDPTFDYATALTLDDYLGDGAPEAAYEHVESIRTMGYDIDDVPNMASDLGCTTAVSSFVLRYLGLAPLTPTQLDQRIGREPGECADIFALQIELLARGVRIKEHFSKVIAEVYMPFLAGQTSFMEMNVAWGEQTGQHTDEEELLFRQKHDEGVVLPGYQRALPDLKRHEKDGTYTIAPEHMSRELLVRKLRAGGLISCELNISNTTSHQVALWRPNGRMPAFLFYPDTEDSGGSYIEVLQEVNLDDIELHSSAQSFFK